MTGVSRRTVIGTGAAVAGALATGQVLPEAASGAPAHGRTGTIEDVKHVVILMQENRSFDHYYGSLSGVRGFADRQQLRYPDGTNVFEQPDANRAGDRVLRPFRMDTTRYDAQEAGDLDHSWDGTHAAANGGAWNRWVNAKGEEAMGYFTRADVPWQYSLADAFTICDHYFCSIQGPTTPNRLFLWTGTNDPAGTAGGPAISNPDDYLPVYRWTTYPERLERAGVSWQVYANTEIGEGDWLGDYGDNPLWLFQAYHDAQGSTDPAVRRLAERGSVTPWQPDAGQGHSVDHVLARFIGDCAAGTLPTVSWIVAPYRYSEHPQARPVDGAAYTDRVLRALWDSPGLWSSTVVLVDFDENDGFFDHVPPPVPPSGTAGEFVDGQPIGLGPRVPMTVVSPWSHGGWVNSQVFDHTSVIRFLELVTGVREPNISAWRRSVCGDLTSCFDFGDFNPRVPTLPDIGALVARADAQASLPPVPAPGPGAQPAPAQEPGGRPRRDLPYQPNANVLIDRATGAVSATLTNAGRAAMSFAVYPDAAPPFAATPVLVGPGREGQYRAETSGGRYAFTVYGPNGFIRAFAGTVVPEGRHEGQIPGVSVQVDPEHGGQLILTLRNAGSLAVRFTLASNDFLRLTEVHQVGREGFTRVTWPTQDGWYDVTITTTGAAPIAYRFAGRVERS
ncbi:phospholipase C, phosphocholine-specific [Rugosimonospora acidiphila]|uniref:phospholipase C n=1 Tax=Rugosimonospora acidiphila TaxID=556531 RepID=A0ABP9RM50_9ACTN